MCVADLLFSSNRNIRVFIFQPGFQFLRKCLDHFLSLIGKCDVFRFLRVFLLEYVADSRLISEADIIGNLLRPVSVPAHEGSRQEIQESNYQAGRRKVLFCIRADRTLGCTIMNMVSAGFMMLSLVLPMR